MLIRHEIKIDLSRRDAPERLDVMQCDENTRAIAISLYNAGIPWEVPAGAHLAVAFEKPDNKTGWYDTLQDGSPACSIDGSQLLVKLAPQMLTAVGIVKAVVVLEDNSKQLTTFDFEVRVVRNPRCGAVKATDYVNMQQWMLDKVKEEIGALIASGELTGMAGVNIFAGKKASFYGDSLTEANYHYTKGYYQWMQEILGLASYNNYGKSGYKVSDVFGKVNSVEDTADIIFVMCGVNDQNFSVPLGTLGDSTTATTYGAFDQLCSLLKNKYPTKLIVFITPHYQTKYPHSGGITSYEVSKAMREVCEKYAIPVYDNFVLSGIYSTNLSAFTTDNCHWNDTAHEMVGKNLSRFMLNSFAYIYGDSSAEDDGGETTVTVTSVSAIYSGGDVAVGTAVDDLTGLVVTATYSDGSTKTVTGYTLSGTIAEGSNTITVSYGGATTIFTVSGIAEEEETPVDYGAWIGKTVTVEKSSGGMAYMVALVANDQDISVGDVVAVTLAATDCINMTTANKTGGGVFGDDSGEVSNGLYNNSFTGGTITHSQTVHGDNTASWTITDRPFQNTYVDSVPYLKVTFMTFGTVPYSFKISDISVTIGGKARAIIALGSFFDSDKEIVTVSG